VRETLRRGGEAPLEASLAARSASGTRLEVESEAVRRNLQGNSFAWDSFGSSQTRRGGSSFCPPPNKPLKLTRPGFGPAAEPPATYINVDGVTPPASSRAADRGANVANGAPLLP
jgi:hypothetical protein